MTKNYLIGSAVTAAILFSPLSQAMEFKFSGQINSAVVFGGDVDDATIVDNNTSGSRFRIKGSQAIGEGYKVGFRYEFQDQDNVSSTLEDRADTDVRYSDVWFSGGFGKVGLGKGDGAANTTYEAYGLINYLGGANAELLFRGATGVGYRQKDGISRQNRIRYDSPKFNGLSFAASLDNGDTKEFGAFYDGKVLGGKLRARAGFVDRDENDRTSYSVAYKHATGLSLAYSYGEDDVDAGDNDVNWIMAGYDIGKVTLSYGTGEESGNDEMQVASINYKPIKGWEIYFNAMQFENADGKKGDAMALGTRLKF